MVASSVCQNNESALDFLVSVLQWYCNWGVSECIVVLAQAQLQVHASFRVLYLCVVLVFLR